MLLLAEFAKMNETDREQAFERMRTTPNGVGVRTRICKLEARYEMTSETMLARWKRGELADTADMSSWLVLLRAAGVR